MFVSHDAARFAGSDTGVGDWLPARAAFASFTPLPFPRMTESTNAPTTSERSGSATSRIPPASISSTRAATAPRRTSRTPWAAASPSSTTMAMAGSTSTSRRPASSLSRPPDCSRGNRLYRNRGDCTFEDVTERAGVGFRGFTHGVAAGDLDGNGFPDLFLTNLGPNVLYLNQGDGTFRDASRGAGAQVRGLVDRGRDARLRPRRRPRPLCVFLRPLGLRRRTPVLRQLEDARAGLLPPDDHHPRAPLPPAKPRGRVVRGRDRSGRRSCAGMVAGWASWPPT